MIAGGTIHFPDSCAAFFRVYRSPEYVDSGDLMSSKRTKDGLLLRLAVAGTTPEDCESAWKSVASWMRRQLKRASEGPPNHTEAAT